MMPTVLRSGPYRFYFYAGDREEPPHVHVERDDSEAKFWIDPVRLQRSAGFAAMELRSIERFCWISGMSILATETQIPSAVTLRIDDESLSVSLSDGRSISVPIAWYPRLSHGSVEERNNWRLLGSGRGIHWPDLDEDISVENLLIGKPSGESQVSFKKWLSSRVKSPS